MILKHEQKLWSLHVGVKKTNISAVLKDHVRASHFNRLYDDEKKERNDQSDKAEGQLERLSGKLTISVKEQVSSFQEALRKTRTTQADDSETNEVANDLATNSLQEEKRSDDSDGIDDKWRNSSNGITDLVNPNVLNVVTPHSSRDEQISREMQIANDASAINSATSKSSAKKDQ